MFNLLAGNGQVIATGERYNTKDSCLSGIESVKANSGVHIEDQTISSESLKNPKYELYKDKAGEFRFRLKASNGEIIAASEGYSTKGSCINGISSIKENAPSAEVMEEKTE